jgi:hypothetical protein
MGMFDSFWARCQACGSDVEFQTKAGDCLLRDYRAGDDIPLEIVEDLDEQAEQCPSCRAPLLLRKELKLTLMAQ